MPEKPQVFHSQDKQGPVHQTTPEQQNLIPQTHAEAALIMTSEQLDARIRKLREEIKKQPNERTAKPYYDALDVYTQQRQVLRSDESLVNLQNIPASIGQIDSRLNEITGTLYAVNLYITNPGKKGPDHILYFKKAELMRREKLLKEKREQLQRQLVAKKAAVPPIRRATQHVQTTATEANAKKRDETVRAVERIRVLGEGHNPAEYKAAPLEILEGFSEEEIEGFRSSESTRNHRRRQFVEEQIEQLNKQIPESERITFSQEERQTISMIEQEVRDFFNKKFARLHIPNDIPLIWPRMIYSRPHSDRYHGATFPEVNAVDIEMPAGPNETTLRVVAHEATHAFARSVAKLTFPLPWITKDGIEFNDMNGTHRWGCLCNGLAIWNQAEIQPSQTLHNRFDRAGEEKMIAAQQRYMAGLAQRPDYFLRLPATDVALFGIPDETLVRGFLQRAEVVEEGYLPDIGLAWLHLAYTQEIAMLVGYKAVKDHGYSLNYNATVTGRDILERDYYTGSERAMQILNELFTEDEINRISKVNQEGDDNNIVNLVVAMRILKRKERELSAGQRRR